MTVADFKELSIGFILEFLKLHARLADGEDIHEEEEKYNKLKQYLPLYEERHQNGLIEEKEYQRFKKRYTALEKRYG